MQYYLLPDLLKNNEVGKEPHQVRLASGQTSFSHQPGMEPLGQTVNIHIGPKCVRVRFKEKDVGLCEEGDSKLMISGLGESVYPTVSLASKMTEGNKGHTGRIRCH